MIVRHDPITAVGQVILRMEEALTGNGHDGGGYFGNHPLPLPEFLAGMKMLGEPRGRFLDLGCGPGVKLALAHYLGWEELVGVERDRKLARWAQRLCPEAEIVLGDAFEVSCSGYAVVYSYRLCQDLDRQHELGRHILATADPGTLVFYPGADLPGGSQLGDSSVWRVA
jgi:SAM-dependent methyltransferase